MAFLGLILGLSALIVITWAFISNPRDQLTDIRTSRGIVIDAGSSHTSFKLFQWPNTLEDLETRPNQLDLNYTCHEPFGMDDFSSEPSLKSLFSRSVIVLYLSNSLLAKSHSDSLFETIACKRSTVGLLRLSSRQLRTFACFSVRQCELMYFSNSVSRKKRQKNVKKMNTYLVRYVWYLQQL